MGLFGSSSKPRRNSQDEPHNMQYWTPRGSIPARMVDVQVQEVQEYLSKQRGYGLYPKVYGNSEENERSLFQGYEWRNDEHRHLVEVPVASRLHFDKKSTDLEKVRRRQENLHYRDRARVAQSEVKVNDPGPFRAVVPTDRDKGQSYGVAGVMYHPEGNTQGFERARVQPLDSQGRQALRRYQDDGARGYRVDTWPPRDESSEDLQGYETRFQRVRKPKPKPQPKKAKPQSEPQGGQLQPSSQLRILPRKK